MRNALEPCEHGVPMAEMYCRECSIVWHEEGEREARERMEHHQRCLASLRGEDTLPVGVDREPEYLRQRRQFPNE